jgi:hypothetical protein
MRRGDAVLDARRNAQAVTAYVMSPTPPTTPHARDASPAIVPGFRLPSAEVVGFKGERHKTFVSVPDTFRCPTFTYVQLSR